MKQLFYSDITKKTYETEEACLEAEKLVAAENEKKEALAAERGKRAKEVEDAYERALEARQTAYDLMREFIHDYGSFHTTLKTGNLGLFDWDPFNLINW